MRMLASSTTDPWWGGDMIWAWIGLAIYFAPTIVAVVRGAGGGGVVFFWNLVLGWTVWGWFVALLLAFGGDRRVGPSQQLVVVNPTVVVHPGSSAAGTNDVVISPSGAQWWDGKRWRDVSTSAPPVALRSPDGGQWWDGTSWRRDPRAESRTRAAAGRRLPDEAPWWERFCR